MAHFELDVGKTTNSCDNRKIMAWLDDGDDNDTCLTLFIMNKKSEHI